MATQNIDEQNMGRASTAKVRPGTGGYDAVMSAQANRDARNQAARDRHAEAVAKGKSEAERMAQEWKQNNPQSQNKNSFSNLDSAISSQNANRNSPQQSNYMNDNNKNILSSYDQIVGKQPVFNQFNSGGSNLSRLQGMQVQMANQASQRSMQEAAFGSGLRGQETRDEYGLKGGMMRDEYGLKGGMMKDEYGLKDLSTAREYGLKGGMMKDEYGLKGGMMKDEYGLKGGLMKDEYGLKQKEQALMSGYATPQQMSARLQKDTQRSDQLKDRQYAQSLSRGF